MGKGVSCWMEAMRKYTKCTAYAPMAASYSGGNNKKHEDSAAVDDERSGMNGSGSPSSGMPTVHGDANGKPSSAYSKKNDDEGVITAV